VITELHGLETTIEGLDEGKSREEKVREKSENQNKNTQAQYPVLRIYFLNSTSGAFIIWEEKTSCITRSNLPARAANIYKPEVTVIRNDYMRWTSLLL